MYAAISAARNGADTVLVDKSLIAPRRGDDNGANDGCGRGRRAGADHWTHHLRDTLEAGRGLCNEELAAVLCEEAPVRIREMEGWKVGWGRDETTISSKSWRAWAPAGSAASMSIS